jgi:hypothetical protein
MMSADHPMGDPTGGVAYGEKNDPISAIISIATMGGTYAAAGSFATMTLMQGLTFAGAALSLAGNVSGNSTLSKIGMVAGIAGGIGSIAESAGWIDKTSTLGETFGSKAASAATSPTVVGNNAPTVTGNTGTNVNTSGAAGYQDFTRAAATAPNVAPPDVVAAATSDAGRFVNGGGGYSDFTRAAAPSTSSVGNAVATEASKAAGATTSAAGGFMDYVNKNPGVVMLGGQLASGLGDWLSGKTDAEIAALQAQSSANQANADLAGIRKEELEAALAREKLRREQLNAGYTGVNASFQVNPYVAQAAQSEQGLIAGAQAPQIG